MESLFSSYSLPLFPAFIEPDMRYVAWLSLPVLGVMQVDVGIPRGQV